MPAESTFDIVSDFDHQELINAVDQAEREIGTRYDLKDSKTVMALTKTDLTITSDSEMHLAAVRDILVGKLIRRQLSPKVLNFGKIEEALGGQVRQKATIQRGLNEEMAKKVQKLLKENFPKVQGRIQGDLVRVGSKSRDDLQAVITFLRQHEEEFPLPLQYTNYR